MTTEFCIGKRLRTAIALLSASLFVAGCSNNPYPAGESEGNILYSTFQEIQSFDPTVSYNADDQSIMDLVYPSYFRYRYPSREKIKIELNLGAEMPKTVPLDVTVKDEKGKTKTAKGEEWTFRLRSDLRFQDDPCFPGGKGRPITANDIVYAIKRIGDPHVPCQVTNFFQEKVVGWADYVKGFSKTAVKHDPNYDATLEGVQVDPKDPYTFHVKLNQPYPQLLYLMAMHFTTPIPREAVEKYGDDFNLYHMVGCGAYKMVEHLPHQRIVLVRNDNCVEHYTDHVEPGDDPDLTGPLGRKLPFIDKIVFTGVHEALTSYNMLQQGYLDRLTATSANVQVIPAATHLNDQMSERGFRVSAAVVPGVDYLAFNMEDKQFGGYTPEKQKLRQAISLSIDRSAYLQVICQDLGKVADFVMPPGLLGYDPNYKNPYEEYDPNLTQAKKLLEEAGYKDGKDSSGNRLTMNFDTYANTPAQRQMIRMFQLAIERLGIKVNERETTYANFVEITAKHQYQFIYYGWYADYPDPENFMFLLYGPNAEPGPNSSNYASKTYDDLYLKMRSMKDSPERLAIINQCRDISVKDCSLIPLTYSESRLVTTPWLTNAKPHPICGDTLKYMILDPAKRSRLQKEWNSPVVGPLYLTLAIFAAALVPAFGVVRTRGRRRVRASKEAGS